MPIINLLKSDFQNVRQIATSCDFDDLQIYIEERQLDMIGLLGGPFYLDVVTNQDDPTYSDLMNGSNFTYECGGKTYTKQHFGLKRVLLHYVYGAYIFRRSIVDTPFGAVRKQAQNSIPVDLDTLESLDKENRRMAYQYWEMTRDYICAARDEDTDFLTLFDYSHCDGCNTCYCDKCDGKGCNNCLGGGIPDTSRHRGIRIIQK